MAATARLTITTDDQGSARKIHEIGNAVEGIGRKSVSGFGRAAAAGGGLGQAIGMVGGKFVGFASKANPAIAAAVYAVLTLRNAVNKFAADGDKFLGEFEAMDEAAMDLGARLGWTESQAERFRSRMFGVADALGKTTEEAMRLSDQVADFMARSEDLGEFTKAAGELEAVLGRRGAQEWFGRMAKAREERGVTMTTEEMRAAAAQAAAFRGLEGRAFVRGRRRLERQISRGQVSGGGGMEEEVSRAFALATGSEQDVETRRQNERLRMMESGRRRAAARSIREFRDSPISALPGSEFAVTAWNAATWRQSMSNWNIVGRGSELVPRTKGIQARPNPIK